MKLYEIQATEYNGEQEYSQSTLLAAGNIDQARQIARDYFQQWYDDGDEPQDHNTGNPDEFEFICGCIRLRIKSVQETTLDEWMTRGIGRSAAELLEACKILTSYTMDLLYRLDNQVNLGNVEEIQQAKDAIAKYTRIVM